MIQCHAFPFRVKAFLDDEEFGLGDAPEPVVEAEPVTKSIPDSVAEPVAVAEPEPIIAVEKEEIAATTTSASEEPATSEAVPEDKTSTSFPKHIEKSAVSSETEEKMRIRAARFGIPLKALPTEPTPASAPAANDNNGKKNKRNRNKNKNKGENASSGMANSEVLKARALRFSLNQKGSTAEILGITEEKYVTVYVGGCFI